MHNPFTTAQLTVGATAYMRIASSHHGFHNFRTGTVTKRTPTGQVTVRFAFGEQRFDQYGAQIGGGGSKWYRNQLVDEAEYTNARKASEQRSRIAGVREAAVALTSHIGDGWVHKTELLAAIDALRAKVESL